MGWLKGVYKSDFPSVVKCVENPLLAIGSVSFEYDYHISLIFDFGTNILDSSNFILNK